jgi:hypothetical protein
MAGFALSISTFLDKEESNEEDTEEKYTEEVIDFDRHVKFLSSIFNKLEKIRLGNIFSRLYSICIDFFSIEHDPVFISINKYGTIHETSDYPYKDPPELTIKEKKYNLHHTKTTENQNHKPTFLFDNTKFGKLDDKFIKKYNLNKSNTNNMNHGIIFIVHEICMQYYAYVLSKQYNRPTNMFGKTKLETFEIRIPEIYGLYLSHTEVDRLSDESVLIAIHSEYISPNTGQDALSTQTLQTLIPCGNIPPHKLRKGIKEQLGFLKTRSKPAIDIKSTEQTRKLHNHKSADDIFLNKENTIGKSTSTRRKRDNMSLNILNYENKKNTIMLHNTIVQFFEYLKKNSLLHLDSSIRNIYFHENQLVIIDFGESYISIHREKSYKSASKQITNSGNIFYVKSEFQRDGYPESKVILNAKQYIKMRPLIDIWLYKWFQDFVKCYGGGLKKKN